LSQSDPLGLLRSQIDKIDEQLVTLLNQRASYALEIAEIKKSQGLDLYAPKREQAIHDRLTEINSGPFPNTALANVFREIMKGTLSMEEG
jgi:chorismate mutase/prephenate dehydratase